MDPSSQNVAVLAALALFILCVPFGLLIYSLRKSRRREREMKRLAEEWSADFTKKGEDLHSSVEGFSICPTESRRIVLNVISRLDPSPHWVFDLWSSDGSPRPGVGFHSQTVLLATGVEGEDEKRPCKTTLSKLPTGESAWLEKKGAVAIYFIKDLLVDPRHMDQFVRDGLQSLQPRADLP